MSDSEENAHILENKWALLEQYSIDNKVDKRRGYENSFEKLCIIGTVETFWGWWKQLPAISDMFYDGTEKIIERKDIRNPNGTTRKCHIVGQCIFKEGIEPKYEDPQNEKGGHLMCVLLKDDHSALSVLWEAIVLGLIGETFDDDDNITGARVIDKSNVGSNQVNHRVEIWFRDWNNESFKETLTSTVINIMKECGCVSTDITIHKNDTSKWSNK